MKVNRNTDPNINPDYVEALKAVVATSPFPKHMSMTLDHIEPDAAVIGLKLAQFHRQPFGIVHGGVIATVIDTATFWAVFLRLPEDCGLVNIDLKLNYLQSVNNGNLIARGSCIRSGRSICYSEANVWDAEKNLVAHGTSTLMVLPGKGLNLNVRKFLAE